MVAMLKPRLQVAEQRIVRKVIQRVRGSAWMATRKRILSKEPRCVECLKNGWLTAATEVDHVVPLHKGGSDDDSNLQGLCHDCHTAKSAVEEAERRGLA